MTHAQAGGSVIVGALVGFLGGLFGKGGSAVATPLLSLLGLPGYVAVASPLPATMPGTLMATAAYQHSHLLDREVVWWGIGVGTPATIIGAWLSRWTGSGPLLLFTAFLVLGFGMAFLLKPAEKLTPAANHALPAATVRVSHWRWRLLLVGAGVGLISGLLANSGGFLLAPCYARFLKLRLKTAFACSLLVSAVLAFPGTLAHWYLGHISWAVAGLVALGTMPLSYVGARLAIRTRSRRLERWYGVGLTFLGVFFLFNLI